MGVQVFSKETFSTYGEMYLYNSYLKLWEVYGIAAAFLSPQG